MKVKIKKLHKNAIIPIYITNGSAGFDFYSVEESTFLKPGERLLFKTGVSIELENGYELQIRPRSGLALNFGITVLNSPGTIDSDYRGEIGVILYNTSKSPVNINKGTRIAQGVICPVIKAEFEEVEELSETERGEGGFGSSGK